MLLYLKCSYGIASVMSLSLLCSRKAKIVNHCYVLDYMEQPPAQLIFRTMHMSNLQFKAIPYSKDVEYRDISLLLTKQNVALQ